MNKFAPTATEDLETFKKSRHYSHIMGFTSNLQKGDLGLARLIKYGYILYGQTRDGKTATGHILSGNPLKGAKISGEDMVEATTSRNKTAKIGNTMVSETAIPNYFEVKMSNPMYPKDETFVIDTPGYGDTKGVLRILANGFYHYRLYSKVENMKFILCFDHAHVRNTCEKFIDTIIQWTSSFKNYFDNRKNIWSSCVFLFTKVEQSEGGEANTIKDLKDKLISISKNLKTQFSEQAEQALKEFIEHIVSEDKIFYIKRVKRGESTTNINLLERIQNKIKKWWTRALIPQKNQVNMDEVMFSISKQIILSTTQTETNQEQFTELIKYYNWRIKEFCETVTEKTGKYSLPYVFHQLTKDAMGAPEQHNFLDVMTKYIQKYYPNFDPSYKDDRQKREKDLFHTEPTGSQLSGQKSLKSKTKSDKNYIVKKFQALKEIEQLKNAINEADFTQRDLAWLEQAQKTLQQIIKAFNKVSFKRIKSTEVIYKYGYLIDRIVEEAKIFLLLIELSSSPEAQNKIRQAADKNFIDLFRFLKDLMGVGYTYNSNNEELDSVALQRQYIKKFNIDDPINSKLVLNEALINFFTEIQIPDDNEGIQAQKIVKLVLRYSDQVLSENQDRIQLSFSDRNKLISRLTLSRINSETAFMIAGSEEDKQANLFLIRNTTKNLGKLLEMSGKYVLARQVYDTIRFVDSVCKMYEIELEGLKKIKEPEIKRQAYETRLTYATYLAQVCRDADALKILQEAYEMASNMNDIKRVKKEIEDLRYKMKDNNRVTSYEHFLFDEKYYIEFPNELENQILQISKNPLTSKSE